MTTELPLTLYRLVGDPRALEREGMFVAEGRLVVERLLENDGLRVHSVMVTAAASAALAPALQRRPDVPVHVCAPEALRQLTGFNFHRGCLALAYRPAPSIAIADLASAARMLAVEGVSDPDNVGGLFRTALALGVGAVVVDAATADPLYRKAIRTSMAATLRVPWTRVDDWGATLDGLRGAGTCVLAMTPASDAVALEDVRLAADARVAVAVGSEGHGLSAATLARADVRVRIPVDPRADSLNVVTAAAIALYTLRKTGTAPVLPRNGQS